ncbi:MAG: hypothetical protein A3K19_00955 [Lentisphaerae bacterium RIFOXYB12_FULL_65_16]|nr:MAG: hypothetical protein A3K18_19000 [Lentisphaerae bacterium RIFOXYA12_64_32]OGV85574.1 MAG: hypothetical protein A3K19_00955 [Lentisphaerae bacterium RIFOXYB12_FULL_65_16]
MEYFCRYVFLTIYGIVKYVPTPLGNLLRYCVLKPAMRRLSTIWINEGVTIHWPGRVSVGKGTSLNEHVFINGYGGVTIGDHVAIGTGVAVFTFEHGFEDQAVAPLFQVITKKPVEIQDDVYIGARAVVLGGVTIGKGAVVGAQALVSRDVPAYAVVAGVPARFIRSRGEKR